jgi:uncharacterized protein (TIGR00369 family)
MSVPDALRIVREKGDFGPLCAAIPYAGFLGLSLALDSGSVLGSMRFSDRNVGNPVVGALHGGTLGALLEFTAVGHLLYAVESAGVPKTINLTVEYLRSAGLVDTHARCQVLRLGRRVAVVRVSAFQADPERPVATATAHFLLDPAAAGTP